MKTPVMKRSPRQRANVILNGLHKGFVWTCMGITVSGTSYLVYRFYKYMTVTRPHFQEQKRLAEQGLLSEGSSDNLKDIAPNIS